MSLTVISVSELYEVASNISRLKKETIVNTYYNKIMVAVHEGKFSITFILENDNNGEIIPEVWQATEALELIIPGILISYNKSNRTITFEWSKEAPEYKNFITKHKALENEVVMLPARVKNLCEQYETILKEIN